MEITFTRTVSYSFDFDAKANKGKLRELADRLDIPQKDLKQLVEDEQLYDEHGDTLVEWLDENLATAEVTDAGEIEVDQINS